MALIDKFDKLGEKISSTGNNIKRQTKNMTNTVKFNGLINDEEKHIDAYCLAIGKLYYENYAENPDSLFTELTSKIKDSKSRIAVYSEQIKQISGLEVCPKCGAKIAGNTPFCGNCGFKMETIQAPVTNESDKRCNKCGFVLSEDLSFCTNCGEKYKESGGEA